MVKRSIGFAHTAAFAPNIFPINFWKPSKPFCRIPNIFFIWSKIGLKASISLCSPWIKAVIVSWKLWVALALFSAFKASFFPAFICAFIESLPMPFKSCIPLRPSNFHLPPLLTILDMRKSFSSSLKLSKTPGGNAAFFAWSCNFDVNWFVNCSTSWPVASAIAFNLLRSIPVSLTKPSEPILPISDVILPVMSINASPPSSAALIKSVKETWEAAPPNKLRSADASSAVFKSKNLSLISSVFPKSIPIFSALAAIFARDSSPPLNPILAYFGNTSANTFPTFVTFTPNLLADCCILVNACFALSELAPKNIILPAISPTVSTAKPVACGIAAKAFAVSATFWMLFVLASSAKFLTKPNDWSMVNPNWVPFLTMLCIAASALAKPWTGTPNSLLIFDNLLSNSIIWSIILLKFI